MAEVAAVEALPPDVEELPELEGDGTRRLDVDDPVRRVGVQERETAPAGHERPAAVLRDPERRRDPDAGRHRTRLAVDEDR